MIKVLFICHGNICRSPMAEFILKDKVKKMGIDDMFYIDSKAVSREEIGNDIYPDAKRCLQLHEITYCNRKAMQIVEGDYQRFDYIFLMDESNQRLIKHIIPEDKDKKISLLLKDRSIFDPWYSGDFEKTYEDICFGIDNFINELKLQGKIL